MKLLDDLNKVRKKVGLEELDADDLTANIFHAKATSYAFHFSLSKEMIHLIGSLASGFSASLSFNTQALRTIEACINRGLIVHNVALLELAKLPSCALVAKTLPAYFLTRCGCAVALMLNAGNFIELDANEVKKLKRRV